MFMFSVSFYTMIGELDHILDPLTVIAALAKSNITTVESVLTSMSSFHKFITLNLILFFSQLPDGALAGIMKTINDAGNVNIVPIELAEQVSVG